MAFTTAKLTYVTDFFVYLKILSADKHEETTHNKWGEKNNSEKL